MMNYRLITKIRLSQQRILQFRTQSRYLQAAPQQRMPDHEKNPRKVAGGHQATISDPNRSDEAKEHSKKILDEEFGGGENVQNPSNKKNPGNVEGGLKATLSNPRTGDDAKQKAKEKLEEMNQDK